MDCCEKHASELRCDYCPWCRIEALEAAASWVVEVYFNDSDLPHGALENAVNDMAALMPGRGE